MPRPKRNVQQQNEQVRGEIVRAANSQIPWLPQILLKHQLDPKSGILVALAQVPDQEGEWFSGLWLSTSEQFWRFEVVIARETNAILAIEQFANVSPETPISFHQPGTGKTFGAIAIETLERHFDL